MVNNTVWGVVSPIKCPLTKQQNHSLLRHNFLFASWYLSGSQILVLL